MHSVPFIRREWPKKRLLCGVMFCYEYLWLCLREPPFTFVLFKMRGSLMKKYILLAALSVSACASNPDKIQSSYVSPVQYADYSCKQVSQEMTNVSRRVSELYGSLDKEASNDSAQMAVGLILFWPALFFLEGGDGPEAAEYARLKGEREALEKVAVQKNCDPSMMPKFETPKRPEPVKEPGGLNE